MKKVIAFNGSPRKNGNTAQLLQAALAGAAEAGAETKLLHVYDMDFTGCGACFACRLLGSSFYAKCIKKDDAEKIMHEMEDADVLLFGSPIHYGKISSGMQRLFERTLNPYNVVEPYNASLWPHKIETAVFLTMDSASMAEAEVFFPVATIFRRLFGSFRLAASTETFRFPNAEGYAPYYMPIYDEQKRQEIHDTKFAAELEQAKELGKKLTLQAERTPNAYREKHFAWVEKNFGSI